MFKLLREVLRVGQATLPYPFQPIEVADGFRGRPKHDPERCIACGACAIACPPNALRVEADVDRGTVIWSLFTGRCIYCARCEEVCPTGAIALSPDFELAVMNKADLYERAEYRLAACRECGAFYAPQKEVDYALTLLQQSGLTGRALAETSALLAICPACRRKRDASRLAPIFHEEVR